MKIAAALGTCTLLVLFAEGQPCPCISRDCHPVTNECWPNGVPFNWTCGELRYKDSTCDCGCGARDPRCEVEDSNTEIMCHDGSGIISSMSIKICSAEKDVCIDNPNQPQPENSDEYGINVVEYVFLSIGIFGGALIFFISVATGCGGYCLREENPPVILDQPIPRTLGQSTRPRVLINPIPEATVIPVWAPTDEKYSTISMQK